MMIICHQAGSAATASGARAGEESLLHAQLIRNLRKFIKGNIKKNRFLQLFKLLPILYLIKMWKVFP